MLRQSQPHDRRSRDWRSLSAWVRRTFLLGTVVASLALAHSSISATRSPAGMLRTDDGTLRQERLQTPSVAGVVLNLAYRAAAATDDRPAEVAGLFVLGLGLIVAGRVLTRERTRTEVRRQQSRAPAPSEPVRRPLEARSPAGHRVAR